VMAPQAPSRARPWRGFLVREKQGRPAVPDLVEVETDPERLVVRAKGEEATGGHRGCVYLWCTFQADVHDDLRPGGAGSIVLSVVPA